MYLNKVIINYGSQKAMEIGKVRSCGKLRINAAERRRMKERDGVGWGLYGYEGKLLCFVLLC